MCRSKSSLTLAQRLLGLRLSSARTAVQYFDTALFNSSCNRLVYSQFPGLPATSLLGGTLRLLLTLCDLDQVQKSESEGEPAELSPVELQHLLPLPRPLVIAVDNAGQLGGDCFGSRVKSNSLIFVCCRTQLRC
jgi:hypothetical protein